MMATTRQKSIMRFRVAGVSAASFLVWTTNDRMDHSRPVDAQAVNRGSPLSE